MKKYFQPEIETMPVEEIKKLQSERLVKQVAYVYEHNKYYRKLMEEKGVTPADIQGLDDLKKLPFLTKNDLREAYPYGLLSCPTYCFLFSLGIELLQLATRVGVFDVDDLLLNTLGGLLG